MVYCQLKSVSNRSVAKIICKPEFLPTPWCKKIPNLILLLLHATDKKLFTAAHRGVCMGKVWSVSAVQEM